MDLSLSVFTQIAASVAGEGVPALCPYHYPKTLHELRAQKLYFMETVQRLTEFEANIKNKQLGITFLF